ncbi:MAG: dihydrolipoamide dehydrogenase [Flavobacteriaceae bacterium]|nr:dihydrolipoamide dehydrogenase [Flavobacteriaceae bacterium]
MKKALLFLAVSVSFFFIACEGDPGPPGPQGEPGINILGQVFEINTDLFYDPGQDALVSPIIAFPGNVEVFESDAILVYRLTGQDNNFNPPADVWTQLPYSEFFADDTGDVFQYNFNHTFFDVQFLIDGNFDVSTLGLDFTTDQIFRVAVVPSEFATDTMSMEQLLEGLQLDSSNITTLGN